MIWNNWPEDNSIPEDIPLNEPVLLRIKEEKSFYYPDPEVEYHVGIFSKTQADSLLGIVGHHFHFDEKIRGWIPLKEFINSIEV